MKCVGGSVKALILVATSVSYNAVLQAQSAVDTPASISQSSTIGMYYSKGRYGQDAATRVRYLPYMHELSFSSWRLKASIPVLEIDGPGNVLIDVGSVGGRSTATVSERGVGDATISATYEWPALPAGLPFFDVTVDLKLPLADEHKGLGTGRPDLGIQVDAYYVLGQVNVFASVGYRYRHRSPVYEQLNDSVNISLGASRSWSDNVQGGLIYDYREAASAFSGDTHEFIPYISWTIQTNWSLMMYIVEGSTQDSADKAIGVQLTRRW